MKQKDIGRAQGISLWDALLEGSERGHAVALHHLIGELETTIRMSIHAILLYGAYIP